MGEIIFEGDPPYAALAVQAASTGRHTLDPTKVLLSLQVAVEGQADDSVELLFLLPVSVACVLRDQIRPAITAVENWRSRT